jgi:2,5-diamino-6-(ribosylamino)-4(3H)-pyrimidinone 5'-phosphate reductase
MGRGDPRESREDGKGEPGSPGPLRRPYIIVNMAMSADGKISSVGRRQVRISGAEDRGRVDELKAESDAVMVGIGTVLADNPSLTVKSADLRRTRVLAGKAENPVRVVVDSRGRTPLTADILHKGAGGRIIAMSAKAGKDAPQRFKGLATVIVAGEDEVDLPLLMDRLHDLGIGRLVVEGGGTLIASLFSCLLVDEFFTFVGNLIIGGKDAPTPVDGRGFLNDNEFVSLSLMDVRKVGEGVLLRWRVTNRR